MAIDNFVVFILSNGRSDRVCTYDTLRQCGYTGPVYIVIDNEDESADEYRGRFGESVLIFDKSAAVDATDYGDNLDAHRAVVYARNACFGLARQVGTTYFMQLDDDYTGFQYRIDGEFYATIEKPIKNLDAIFGAMLYYYKSIPALSIAMAQSGDFIGGDDSNFDASINQRRKAMNTFICSVDRQFEFMGKINEDVNAYVSIGNRGGLFLTFSLIMIHQKTTQKNKGGLTDIYLDVGTYVKSFYTVMYQPSSVTIELLPSRHPRLHHKINWDCTVPCIISEKHKKLPMQVDAR